MTELHRRCSAGTGGSLPGISRSSSAGGGGGKGGLSQPAGWRCLLSFIILFLACVCGFISRLFAVIRFESLIHEFDPWFNYRSTHHLTTSGFYEFLNWFDERAWYPLGRIVGGTVYPGLMVTAGLIHYILNLVHLSVHIRDVCVFLAPVFSALTAIATFLLTRELWSQGAGLLSACFMAVVPGYISRSVAGSFDNEAVAIFALQFTYFLWVKSIKTGSVFWTVGCCLSYFYMVSAWGGYVFIINLIPLHVFVLLLMRRFKPANTWQQLESDFLTPQGEFRVDKAMSPALLNSLMYKMSYYRFGEMQLDFRTPPGFDRTRNAEIGNKDVKLKHLEEAFTSEHWLVRINKVKDLDTRQSLGRKPRVTGADHKHKHTHKL